MNNFKLHIPDPCNIGFTQHLYFCGVYADTTVSTDEIVQMDEFGCEQLQVATILAFVNIEWCDILDEQLFALQKLNGRDDLLLFDLTDNCVFKNLENVTFESEGQGDNLYNRGRLSFLKSKTIKDCCDKSIKCVDLICSDLPCSGATKSCCYSDTFEPSFIGQNILSQFADPNYSETWEITKLEVNGVSHLTGQTYTVNTTNADFVNINGTDVLTNQNAFLASLPQFSGFTFEPCVALSEPNIFSDGGFPIPATRITYPSCIEWCISARPIDSTVSELDSFTVNQDGYVEVDGATTDLGIQYFRGARFPQDCIESTTNCE